MPDLPYAATDFVLNPARLRAAYPPELRNTFSPAAIRSAAQTISGWPGYAPTPLVDLPDLARDLGLGRIRIKDEGGRFGLGSFKALGGAYAVERIMAARQGGGPVTVCCATDGNHGRSVAWGAQKLGARAVIFIHETVSEARAAAIARYGATVIRTPGTYDDSVREADRQAREKGWIVVSDTSYPGYTEIPRDVMQGYGVMVAEALDQMGGIRPTHAFVQGGVGGLAAAVTAGLWLSAGDDPPVVTVVEPETAACLLESARAGKPVAVGGDLDTIMAGLACGEPSLIAWPVLAAGAAAFMAITDRAAEDAMRRLALGAAGARLRIGESGVAGLAGLIAAAKDETQRAALGLGPGSDILLIGSEGDTDPDAYARIVGALAEGLA